MVLPDHKVEIAEQLSPSYHQGRNYVLQSKDSHLIYPEKQTAVKIHEQS